jgi:hypothetical protein
LSGLPMSCSAAFGINQFSLPSGSISGPGHSFSALLPQPPSWFSSSGFPQKQTLRQGHIVYFGDWEGRVIGGANKQWGKQREEAMGYLEVPAVLSWASVRALLFSPRGMRR